MTYPRLILRNLWRHPLRTVLTTLSIALSIFLGVEVISKVPTLLHTPLMSGTNAIHGIVIVGALFATALLTVGRLPPPL